ncbi:hypothetical protein N7456_005966 [Penicillium angulare]|uniref:Uncharacterized protein n=1 Tax=Penicillium angulare TaxID=116970 RepID=A0A9W9KKR4_9EURO|nr:hypothetical protein N7456_005966 [Penicillium angulare]
MNEEKLIRLLANETPLVETLRHYLSLQEAVQILEQFESDSWLPNGQVLWSGMPREKAQQWADRHRLQTLTTAMGPLMDVNHPNCLKSTKTHHQWSKYVHGASALFAWRIANGEEVTLLSPPPPERFHPSGLSYYQVIEEPIIRGSFGQNAVHKINIVHPLIKGSDEFFYELWPNDRRDKWVERFGLSACKMKWRQVRHSKVKTKSQSLMAFPKQHFSSPEELKYVEQHKPACIKPLYIISLLLVFLITLSQIPVVVLFYLLYLLLGKTWNGNDATKDDKVILKTPAATPITISAKATKAEHPTETSGQGATYKMEACEKSQKNVEKKIKNEKKARAKAQEEAARKLKNEKKARAKAQEEAARKLKNEKKARAKAQEEAARKLKNEKKARAKAQEEAARKLKNEKKARAKAQEEAARKLKNEKKARAKAQEEAARKIENESKARAKAQQEARKST